MTKMAKMESCVMLTLATLLLLCHGIHGWGVDGHLTVCRIAQVCHEMGYVI